jgi:Zn-dependent peptidase ImmA (M78 family)
MQPIRDWPIPLFIRAVYDVIRRSRSGEMAQVEHINPRILTWAREAAGFTIPEAAPKLGLKDGMKASAADKLVAIELGDGHISRTVLQKAASVFRRPLITFYLPEPPRRGERGEDFRTPGSGIVSSKEESMLDALVRNVRARQQLVREILEDEEEAVSHPFVGSISQKANAKAVSDAIRETLGVPTEAQRRAHSPEQLFAHLRAAAERAGVYVLLLGDLGSPQSDIGEHVFRGFALADDIAPIVVINDNDAAAGRSFTLVHELAHIFLGASGISGPLRRQSSHAVERLCNDAAGHFLLPPGALEQVAQAARGADVARANELSAAVASQWHVSQGVVVYRFVRNGWISEDVASALFAAFTERWRKTKEREKAERDPDADGPGYYQLRRSMVGARLLDLSRRALQGGTISRTTAAKVLGVRPTGVDSMLFVPERARRT